MGTESQGGWRRLMIPGVVVLLAGAAGLGGWLWWKGRPREAAPPSVEVLKANNRGVGLMEQFQYRDAARAFEEVVRMAPDWLPAKINLAIALMNDTGEDQAKRRAGQQVDKAAGEENRRRARRLFTEVLSQDPDNPYAHFCLGIIMTYEAKPQEAGQIPGHFKAVIRKDPSDPAAWYWLGKSLPNDPRRAAECFRKALRLNPNLGAAAYNLATALRQLDDPQEARKAMKQFDILRVPGDDKSSYGDLISNHDYGEMGRYADVIGRVPGERPRTGPVPLFRPSDRFRVELAKGTRWAGRADFGKDVVGRLRARVRERFGGVLVVLDFNNDGQPDLFLVGAVVRDGKVGDLLLRNDGGGRFTDVTKEAGLAGARPSLGCCVADYDNDGRPDLLITGAGEQHLFRNTGRGRFEDVSARAELDRLKTICLGAAFLDLDQDGDLDLVVAQYGSLDQADRALQAEGPIPGGGLAVFLNVGEALPGRVSQSHPLTTRFRRVREPKDPHVRTPTELLGSAAPVVNVAVGDIDHDQDVDLLVLADDKPPVAVLNDRVLRFHRRELPDRVAPRASWNGALVLDADRDGRSDLLLVGPGQAPRLLLGRPGSPDAPGPEFTAGDVKSPPLRQAQAIDLDLDGWTDVVGLSDKGLPVLLHNTGGKLVHAPEALGADRDWPGDLVGIAVGDFNGDGLPDFLVWSEAKGLQLHEGRPNGNHGLRLALFGHRHVPPNSVRKMRSNADGIGVKVAAQAGALWTGLENATLSAGLGQSRLPLVLGLGRATEADVVRLNWPDGTLQAELNVPTAGAVVHIEQAQRRLGSCPVLFTWDGERYVFVTDFLGAGSVGEPEPDGGYRRPRPEESVKIEPHQLRPRDGEYILQIAEPMDEITYLDRLRLLVIDHPADVVVYPDERFTDSPPPSQKVLAFRTGRRVFPEKAVDHRGHDVTRTLREWDRDTVRNFARRAWIGLAEEHGVELDFGKQLARFRPGDRLFLCLAGWTEYPWPESFWAAHQAGVEVLAPVLERLEADGPTRKWEPVVTAAGKPVEVGFPAGLPKMMTLEVTGLVGKHSRQPLCGPRCVLRLRTNLEVYWDQAFIAPLEQRPRGEPVFRRTALDVARADLSARGLMQEFSPDGREPTLYDFERVDRVPVSRLAGRMTRYGPVTELLREADDCFVIFGPGDLLTVRFDARRLPALPHGWTRSFVLRTWGYCKDGDPFTATGGTVGPLPFRKMSNYPYGPKEHYPRDARHRAYLREYNTRQVGRVTGG